MLDVSSSIFTLFSAYEWLWKLRTQFRNGSYKKLDYCFFSPKKSEGDTTKYPLIVYVHWLAHGWHKRSQVNDSYFPYMISSEMQSKFHEGWCHILLPRLPEYMFDVVYTSKMQKLIENYVNQYNSNIDVNQIYIMWSSAGWWMAWRLLLRKPDFYNKALITCANKIPFKNQLKIISDKPIWLVSAKKDPIIPFAFQRWTWNMLKKITKIPELCRWTVFPGKVYCPDGKKARLPHMLAKVISYDFHLLDWTNVPYDWVNYPFTRTKLATDETIPTSGIIEWLQDDE